LLLLKELNNGGVLIAVVDDIEATEDSGNID
jgi:hypothetical protein